MRKHILSCLFTAFLVAYGLQLYAQIGINSDNSQPDPSAMLDVKSTNKGILPPRVALTAINSASPITSPAIGLHVYNTATAGTSPNNVFPGDYCWNGTKWIPVVAPQGTSIGDMQYWNGTQWVKIPVGTNGQVLTLTNGIPSWGQPSSLCGISFTINHIAGIVAPVSKTVTYGTVTNISGATTKCWITSNLGADHQATAVNDATEASAGWYWQFNRKQGYKHDGTTRTPNTTWITSINENLDWQAGNDPCTLELGAGWRVPTGTEWTNLDAAGSWTNWYGPWNCGLRIHAAGFLDYLDSTLINRGSGGYYWSGTQFDAITGYYLDFYTTSSCYVITSNKTSGFTLRCLKD